jgi:hypothetical protein
MTFSRLGMFALQIRLALIRFGWSKSIAGALCITGLAAWLWGIPHLHEQQSAQRLNWLRAQQVAQTDITGMPAERHTTAEENYNHFTAVLGDPLDTEKQIKTLFALARKTGLTLSQAEYKLADDKNGRYRTYQILLPVKGSYSAIRHFCEKSLLAIPFASLDEMGFKRETIGSGTLEARLRFTLYLSESSPDALNKGPQNFNSQKEAS